MKLKISKSPWDKHWVRSQLSQVVPTVCCKDCWYRCWPSQVTMKIPDSPHLGLDTAHNDQRVITTFHHRQNAATRLADSIAVHWFDGCAGVLCMCLSGYGPLTIELQWYENRTIDVFHLHRYLHFDIIDTVQRIKFYLQNAECARLKVSRRLLCSVLRWGPLHHGWHVTT